MATGTERRERLPRGSLTRELVVSAAREVLEETGLDGFSIEKVARRLGAAPMALYRHVGRRDELIDLVFQDLLDAFPRVPEGTGSWDSVVADYYRRMRTHVLDRPILLDLFFHPKHSRPVGSRQSMDIARLLHQQGCPHEDALGLVLHLNQLWLGCLALERGGVLPAGEDSSRALLDLISRADDDPAAVAAAVNVLRRSPAENFERTLAFALDGIRHFVATRKGDARSSPGAA